MSQQWNADQYVGHASFVAEYGNPVLALLQPLPSERILDLGCGDGALTLKLADSGAQVLGVDASPDMVAAARRRGLAAEVVSGEALSFNNEFDAVFSNAALHWMKDSDAVLRGVHCALKPGGRFVGELGGEGNIAALVAAMQAVFAEHPELGAFDNPWYFPSVDDYSAALERCGFEVNYIERFTRPTPLPSGVIEWLKTFSNGITRDLDAGQQALFLRETERRLVPVLLRDGEWVADYVRLRFAARKPLID